MQQGIKEKDVRDMQKCFEKMYSIMQRIQEYNPNAQIVIVEAGTIALTGLEDFDIFDKNDVVAEKYIPKMNAVNIARG